MFGVGAIGFTAPWVLLALATLPAIWWLVRLTPPSPRQTRFPALQLLLDIAQRQETPERTPWWLILLRVLLAGLVVIGLAGPVLNPIQAGGGSGPLLIVVDDGWAAASRWPDRMQALAERVAVAEAAGRPIRLLTTAPDGNDLPAPPALLDHAQLRGALSGLLPKPWAVDRRAAIADLDALPADAVAETLWLADGVEDGAAADFAGRLARFGPVTRLDLPPGNAPFALGLPMIENGGLSIDVARPVADGPRHLTLLARNETGQILGRRAIDIGAEEPGQTVLIDLPAELRNKVTRVDIADEASAAAIRLLDGRWRRRAVGIAFEGGDEAVRPLVSEAFFLQRAMAPFADVRRAPLAELVESPPAVIVLPDIGQVPAAVRPKLNAFIEKGGVLLRFAGPRFAVSADDLLPVRIRQGDRALGGALSWSQPASIAPFAPDSPFAGLTPSPDVRIRRQVLAEPAFDLDKKTWARLTDGTPLITGERRGAGLIVLVHTSANSEWSDLALSGLFVEMLRRITALADGGDAVEGDRSLPPLANLDGFGHLGPVAPGAGPIAADTIADTVAGPRSPPGYYGDPAARRALNLMPALDTLAPLPAMPGVAVVYPEVAPARP
ncbi:MAG: BatA domain-containing protein, partial [Zavarzinia sp.]|nr:BatA domain-containing protein [Zavarzinia sp.]